MTALAFTPEELGAVMTLGGTAAIIATARELVEYEEFDGEEFFEFLARVDRENAQSLIDGLSDDLHTVFVWAARGMRELADLEASLIEATL